MVVVTVRLGGPADVAGVQPLRKELWGPLEIGDTIVGEQGCVWG